MKASKIQPSRWWTSLAKPKVLEYEPGYVALGKDVAEVVGRRPWAHTAFTRFVATGQISGELATAVSIFFKLPRPTFLARSVRESFEMEKVMLKYDNEPIPEIEAEIIEMEERLRERKRELEERHQLEASKMKHAKSSK